MKSLHRRGRRTLEALVVAAVALAAAGASPALGAAGPPPAPKAGIEAVAKAAAGGQGLSSHEKQLLQQARAAKQKRMTVILMADKGRVSGLQRQVGGLGGTVVRSAPTVGYVRASVPTAAVEKVARLADLAAIDLDESIPLPQPEPYRSAGTSGKVRAAGVSAPGAGTPAANPYLPTDDTNSVRFKKSNPTWDGRGVTIGVLDSGVSLDNPALQTTSTGERKIVDWVTETDPAGDGDGTWRPMQQAVTGPAFTAAGAGWTAPAGSYLFNTFAEDITQDDQLGGDVNRDGDTSDTFGILYDPESHDIRVDSDQDHDFADNLVMRPYNENYDVGHFGTDNPATPVRDQVPFVVEYREDVDLFPLGQSGTADFVNIGIPEDEHGSHVAGIAAGNDMFGNPNFDGQAPGAKIVSARACSWGGGCTAAALADGVVDLVANRHVDIVNISIGGLPALNDGDNARALLYNALIDYYDVQFFISAGNSGPGVNTVGDPGVVSDAVSVGASVTRATWLANYGSVVRTRRSMFPFSSRGPREDGGFKPNISAPGAAISTVDSWLPGNPVPEAGYALPPGYAMLQGTSMAAPEATGAGALLLSAAFAQGKDVTPAQLRRALYSSADFDPEIPAIAQGNGLLDVRAAWKLLSKAPTARQYDIAAPVCTVLSGLLNDPNVGTGVFNNCAAGRGGQAPGVARDYQVTITRMDGPRAPVRHAISWLGNDGTFSAPSEVVLPRGVPVPITVTATATIGSHSAVLRLDDPATKAVDYETMNEVVVANELAAPEYSFTATGSRERNSTGSYFVDVPDGTATLQVDLSGLAAGSQVRWIAVGPYGVPLESTSSLVCYPNRPSTGDCDPLSRAYQDPLPGIWEFEVEARRTSPLLDNPFQLTAKVQGVTVTPDPLVLPSATIGSPSPVSWTVHNDFGATSVHGEGGPLGSSFGARPSIQLDELQTYDVVVPAGATRLDARIGNAAEPAADLDLYLVRDDEIVAASADGDSEEAVTLADPEPGSYQVWVYGYDVPAAGTPYDYQDVFYAPGLGALNVPATPQALMPGGSGTISGTVLPAAGVSAGRQLFGELRVVTDQGAVIGRGRVRIDTLHP